MKKILTFFAFVILVVGISAFTIVEHGTVEETKTLEGKPKIEWLSWEEGIKKSEESNEIPQNLIKVQRNPKMNPEDVHTLRVVIVEGVY